MASICSIWNVISKQALNCQALNEMLKFRVIDENFAKGVIIILFFYNTPD